MKWYCIRPRCLPADQVKDMLVPEKCASASVMDGVQELPDGFREATITCLEAIRDVSRAMIAGWRLCVFIKTSPSNSATKKPTVLANQALMMSEIDPIRSPKH